MQIRLDSNVEAPDIIICDNIKISGRIAKENESFEYKIPLTLTCANCDDIHEVWILI